MNREGMIRTGKVLGMVVGAIVILLVLRLFLGSTGHQPSARRISVLTALAGEDGVPTMQRNRPPADVVILGSDGSSVNGVIVFLPVAGYQSEIDVAYRFDKELSLEGFLVVESAETPPIDRILVRDGIDGLSGATITSQAIAGGTYMARRHAERTLAELE